MLTRALALLLATAPALQADGPESGPKAGAKVEPLPAFVAAGDKAGQAIDLAAEREGRPTVYLFVQAEHWTRPMARFVKVLDGRLAGGVPGAEDASAVLVWLADDVPKGKEYLPVAQNSLNLARTSLAVFEGSRFGPDGWGINADAFLTAVVVRGGQVVRSTGYRSVGESDVPAVVESLERP
jgi:hypothetical protein